MKVIHILHHSDLQQSDSKFKFDLYQDEFSVRVAKQILKQTKKYEIECWRPERRLKKIISGEKDGIMYKAFPSFYYKFGKEYSRSLMEALRKESKKNGILIHLHGIHNYLAYTISYLFRDVPIVGSQLGSSPYTYKFIYSNRLDQKIRLFPLYLLEPSVLRGMDEIFAATKEEYKILSKFHSGVKLFHSVGIDFDKFKPINKQKAREMLSLPLDKKIMLHVGQFYPLKGVDIILDTYKKLRSKYDIELLLIGGHTTEPLYEMAIKSNAIVIERIPRDELIQYYSAADIYLLPEFHEHILFGGIGTAPIESLACGTPVVGTNLRHFIGNELGKVGKIPISPEEVGQCVSEIFDDPSPYKDCREIAKKYYDWKPIINRIVNTYDELFKKYYR